MLTLNVPFHFVVSWLFLPLSEGANSNHITGLNPPCCAESSQNNEHAITEDEDVPYIASISLIQQSDWLTPNKHLSEERN